MCKNCWFPGERVLLFSGTTHVFGHPAVQRTQTDRHMKGILIPYPHHQIPWNRGVITEWHFYIQTVASVDVSLQVWRKRKESAYSLVGQTVFKGLRPGRHDVILNARERIDFQAGDVFGVMFSRFNPIPFDTTARCHDMEEALYMDNPPPSVHAGDVYTFEKKDRKEGLCKLYSLFANLETASE